MFQQQDIRNGLPLQSSAETSKKHPAQLIQELKYYAEEEMAMRQCAVVYGSGLAMQLAAERHLHGQPSRLPGLKSSYLGLEIAMDKLGVIEYEDFLSQDQFTLPKKTTHDYMMEQF